MDEPLYFDYAASTPVDPEVAEQMTRVLTTPALAANAAASHGAGRAVLALIEDARADVAALINADPDEVIFTSGATEADNLAIIGTARFQAARGRHLVTALTEHPAVLEPCRYLAGQGWQITWLKPDAHGLITGAQVEAALRPDTLLVSLMHTNHETGVVQDIAAIGAVCRRRDVLFHVDAAQGAGREAIDVRVQGIDLLSLSAHKLYGPKGVGALCIDRERVRRIEPLLRGGSQERGMRPGTLATHQIAGMGAAFRLGRLRRVEDRQHLGVLRDRLWGCLAALPGVLRNGHGERHAGHILSVSVADVDGESLRYALRPLHLASGSACTSFSPEPSQVLRALGRTPALARATLRFSFGRPTTVLDIDRAAALCSATIPRLQALSPAAADS